MMMWNSQLSFYPVILSILPSLYSLPTEELLLGSYHAFGQGGEPGSSLSKGAGIKIHTNQEVKIEIPKREITESFKGVFPKHNHRVKVATPWQIYYEVAEKASRASVFPQVKRLAESVLKLGSDLNNIPDGSQIHTAITRDIIDLARSVIRNEVTNEAERIWALGIFSYLNPHIHVSTPVTWKDEHLSRPREDLQLFLLKDHNLKKVVHKIWSSSPSKAKPSELISETMQRESSISFIQKELDSTSHAPSKDFSEIYLSFINLRSPICWDRLSTFKKMILSFLSKPIISSEREEVFDEEKNVIRLLLYLEEHHYIGFRDFNALIKNKDICPRILHSDIEIQLSDNRLASEFKLLLKKFQNSKDLEVSHITQILRVKSISSQQLKRFIRVLDALFESNEHLFKSMALQLNDHPKMIPDLVKILPNFLPDRTVEIYSLWDRPKELKTLVLRKQEDQIAEKHRNHLADTLISNRVLSTAEAGKGLKVLTWNFATPRGIELTKILHDIFKVVSRRFTAKDFRLKNELIEYILHLISLKNDDKRPFWYLPVEDKALRNANRFNELIGPFLKKSKNFFNILLGNKTVPLRNSGNLSVYLNSRAKAKVWNLEANSDVLFFARIASPSQEMIALFSDFGSSLYTYDTRHFLPDYTQCLFAIQIPIT
ncbi:uncharacterized protein MELLADRAFT_65579 [Melampsora larici-populina 98AG31]|uniref:Secreted protein n=1 Tax=Melampsora larici-populina (strain 98AG31 / pathotype 3-4-7) TaxID=747676 RepID=F4RVY5_MELLP|nr:uncharacterized protein MELLADRAFT_65579 [Melampsora larici-populina 98AG31]EGG03441.1 hypothetical protein MELLADRAFT_65579 [Melampsora larici-populina 98AG31]